MPGLTPRTSDERDNLLTFLQQQRDVLRVAAYGLTDEQAAGDLGLPVPVPKGVPWYPQDVEAWSVRWLLLHLIGGRPATPDTPTSCASRSTVPPPSRCSPPSRIGRRRPGCNRGRRRRLTWRIGRPPPTRQADAVTRFVAMLRAVNVTGRNRVKMPELKALVEGLGHTDVVTYLQSGNVVLTARQGAGKIEQELERALDADLGVGVRVLVRTGAELAEVARHNPFLAEGAEPKQLHVTFLATAPDRAKVSAVPADAGGRDQFRVGGREIYLHCPDGYGRSKLINSFWEKRLALEATTRNWNTVVHLLELAEA
jgi:uncharacterized protein (DUF1697 family)